MYVIAMSVLFLGYCALNTSRVLAQTASSNAANELKKSKQSFRAQNDVLYYGEGCAISSTATIPGAGSDCKGTPLPTTIPEYWRNLIDNAALKHPDADRRLVAAALWIENRGWPDPNKNWVTSSSGAKGPWQFIPSSWEIMGEDCNNDGIKDPNNPADAVCAAFNHFKGSACKPILEGATGNAENDYNNIAFKRDGNNTLMSALANYNGNGTQNGIALAKQNKGQNPDYVRMGYWLISSNFSQTVNLDSGNGEKKDINNSTGSISTPSTGTNSASACPSNSGGSASIVQIGDYRYAFPVILPKSDVSNGFGWPCPSTCHHDGTPAFDLSKKAEDDSSTGVSEVAITDGTIQQMDGYMGIDGCFEFQLKARDGYYYYYTHLSNPLIQAGATVAVGQKVAEIGRRACTGIGSYPHLHIDRGSPKGRLGGSVCCRDQGMIPLINELYTKLPDNGINL